MSNIVENVAGRRTCVFCGGNSGRVDWEETAQWCREHIKNCPDHPMRALEARIEEQDEILYAYDATRHPTLVEVNENLRKRIEKLEENLRNLEAQVLP